MDGVNGAVIPHARKTVEVEHIGELDSVTVLLLQVGEIHVLEIQFKPKLVELTLVMVCIWYLIV